MSSVSAQSIERKAKAPSRRFPRRNYFINKSFQLAFAGNMLLITLIAAGVTALFVSWMFVYVFEDRLLFANTMNAPYLLKIGFILAGLVAGVIIWTILRTHAIAGPIHKTRQILRDAAKGRFPKQPVAFRRGDAFKGLAEDLNHCLGIMELDRERLELLQKHVDAKWEHLSPEKAGPISSGGRNSLTTP